MIVEVKDGKQSIVSTKRPNYSPKGFHEFELKLAEEVNEGLWEIAVSVDDDEQARKTFAVKEYRLSDFEVSIDTQDRKDFYFNDQFIWAKVSARHTFGSGSQQAKGSMKVSVQTFSADAPEKVSSTFSTIPRNGEVKLSMLDLKINRNWQKSLVRITVLFEHEWTRRTASKELLLTVHKENIRKLEKIHEPHYTPGKEFKIAFLLKNVDGSVAKQNGKVKVMAQEIGYRNPCTSEVDKVKAGLRQYAANKEIPLNNGIAEISFVTPEKSHGLLIGVYYNDKFESFKVRRILTKAKENLRLKIKTER